jgi:hypothetical protein
MTNLKTKTPFWYWILAVFFLLWNIMGAISFYVHTFISEESFAGLSEAERELYGDYPFWITLVFAVAVFFGLLGSVGLILKRKWAKLAFIISICAIVPQMIHNVFFTNTIAVYGIKQAITMPILLVGIGFILIIFSNYSIKKNWLK